MKQAMVAGLLLCLTGCVTTAPQSIGRDTYVVETMGTNMTVGPALKKATAFCAQQNKKVNLLTTDKAGLGIGANTSITFQCLDPNDRRYSDPVTRKDIGVTTTEVK